MFFFAIIKMTEDRVAKYCTHMMILMHSCTEFILGPRGQRSMLWLEMSKKLIQGFDVHDKWTQISSSLMCIYLTI